MNSETRILIVDDEKNFRELLRAILKKKGLHGRLCIKRSRCSQGDESRRI